MAIYVVIPLGTNRPKLDSTIRQLPEESVFSLPENAGWLVKYAGTAKELCAKLGAPVQKDQFSAESPTVLVTLLKSQFGFAPTEMWDWVQTRSEA